MRDPSFALWAHGYPYLSRLRSSDGHELAPAVAARLYREPTLVIGAPDGLGLFYDESKVHRAGAIPAALQHSLFGRGAVHCLDGAARRHRKEQFLSVFTPDSSGELARIAVREMETRLLVAAGSDGVGLFDEAVSALGAAAFEWVGVHAERDPERRSERLMEIVDAFGGIGIRRLFARSARLRADHWARSVIDDTRSGTIRRDGSYPLAGLVAWTDEHGGQLDRRTAAVELLNLVRPIVAVAWLVVFAAVYLHDDPELRERVAGGNEATARAFAHEVRRLAPFVPMLGARANRTLEWSEHVVLKDQLVLFDLYGSLHDPALFPRPDALEIDRFLATGPDPSTLVPHGGGPRDGHRCPGERATVDILTRLAPLFARSSYDILGRGGIDRLRRMPPRLRDVTVRFNEAAKVTELWLAGAPGPGGSGARRQ